MPVNKPIGQVEMACMLLMATRSGSLDVGGASVVQTGDRKVREKKALAA